MKPTQIVKTYKTLSDLIKKTCEAGLPKEELEELLKEIVNRIYKKTLE